MNPYIWGQIDSWTSSSGTPSTVLVGTTNNNTNTNNNNNNIDLSDPGNKLSEAGTIGVSVAGAFVFCTLLGTLALVVTLASMIVHRRRMWQRLSTLNYPLLHEGEEEAEESD